MLCAKGFGVEVPKGTDNVNHLRLLWRINTTAALIRIVRLHQWLLNLNNTAKVVQRNRRRRQLWSKGHFRELAEIVRILVLHVYSTALGDIPFGLETDSVPVGYYDSVALLRCRIRKRRSASLPLQVQKHARRRKGKRMRRCCLLPVSGVQGGERNLLAAENRIHHPVRSPKSSGACARVLELGKVHE